MPNNNALDATSLVELMHSLDKFYGHEDALFRETKDRQEKIIAECDSSIRALSEAEQLQKLNDQYRDAFTKSHDAGANDAEINAARIGAEELRKRVIEMARRVANEAQDPRIMNLRERKQAAELEIELAYRRLDTLRNEYKNLHISDIKSLYGKLFPPSNIVVRQKAANELQRELKNFSDSIQLGRGGNAIIEEMHAKLLSLVPESLTNRIREDLSHFEANLNEHLNFASSSSAAVAPASASVVPVVSASSSVVSGSAAPALVGPAAAASSMAAHISSGSGYAGYVSSDQSESLSAGKSLEMMQIPRPS